jgi:hypothetical protein
MMYHHLLSTSTPTWSADITVESQNMLQKPTYFIIAIQSYNQSFLPDYMPLRQEKYRQMAKKTAIAEYKVKEIDFY